MADPKDSNSDGHIEELLSQLQGIFGKLSQSEEEEARDKVDLPRPTTPTPPAAPRAPVMEPSPEGAPPLPERPHFEIEHFPEQNPFPDESLRASPDLTPPAAEPPAAAPPVELPVEAAAEQQNGLVSTVIYYPNGREAESKMLSQKLETMAPKFTRVEFKLHVVSTIPYDPRNDPREVILAQNLQGRARAVFCIVERAMDETRKKSLARQLEGTGIYFQDVMMLSIEKKAFYTDLLLGLVFFFDSLKSDPGAGAAS